MLDESVYGFQDVLVWSKIYKKNTIIENQIEFPEVKLWEDGQFIFSLIIHINKIIYLENYAGYIRHTQKNSLSHTLNQIKSKDMIDIFYDAPYYKNNSNSSWLLTCNITFCLMNIFFIFNDKKEVYKLLNYLYTLEKETDFNDTYLDTVYKIPNKLIMKKHFKLAIIYFNITKRLFESKTLRKLYRKLTNEF